MSETFYPLTRALLSVSDKTGLVDLARALVARGVEILSTGGTAAALRAEGIALRDVSEVTGFPEIMDGRVKTLHPGVHGGLLARRDLPAHLSALAAQGLLPIDLLVVNLYPFEKTLAAGGDRAALIENIDVGGPAMTRAAAKNHDFVTVLTAPEDYAGFLADLAEHNGASSLAFRRQMAAKAFARTAAYDAEIATWMAADLGDPAPARRVVAGQLLQALRYGENPHQRAAFYQSGPRREGVTTARQWQGKELSWNNIHDTDAAYELAAEFDPGAGAACVIVKHANPCGVARGESALAAYRRALATDPVSAFGGIIALNRPLDGETAEAIAEIFTEVVIAPGASEAARAIFAAKKNLRLLTTESLPDPRAGGDNIRSVAGGFLWQDRDVMPEGGPALQVVTKRAPSAAELDDLRFAWTVAKHVKSNAIVYAKGGATLGIGAGQMSRVDSSRIARRKAEEAAAAAGLPQDILHGAVVASDAFFPFADGLLAAAEAGVSAVIQPGGSQRDGEVIAAADAAGLAMVFTGMRHFRH